MKFSKAAVIAASVALTITSQLNAADAKRTYPVMNEEIGVPVFPYDITDRPYQVLGDVAAGAGKTTLFSAEVSQKKLYEKLWAKAEKMGADAIINAKYGDSHITAFSWGKTNATGTAIKFTTASAATASSTPSATPAAAVSAQPDMPKPVTATGVAPLPK